MEFYLTSAYPTHPCLVRVRELYSQDIHGAHKLVSTPEEADAIIFVENTQFHDMRFTRLLDHPLVREFPHKVYMYNEMDRAWPVLPGLYCSLAARFARPGEQIAFPYVTVQNSGVEKIHASRVQRKWLYSFVGSASHPVRKKILELGKDHDTARIVDTSEFCTWNPAQTSKYAYQKLYTDTMAASKFVLCPRGIGPASLRLYETLEAGRIPVIISDTWIAPPQINWDFAVRVPEFEISTIPERLAELEPQWQERSAAAREAWESTYAPEHMFNTFADAIRNINRSTNLPEPSLQVAAFKWKVLLEQKTRNWLKPPAGSIPNQGTAARQRASDANPLQSLLGRLFYRHL